MSTETGTETGAEELEEYQIEANALKDKGNAAFQSGDLDLAIRFFSQAIDLDPDNHVLYSNRSAAYMKADSKSKALWDAEKCVQLAPRWAKGYGRLGVAQQSLRRFDAAIDSYKKGIELDPNNKTLWASLRSCQEARETDKQQRFAAAQRQREEEELRVRRREEIREEMMKEKKEVEEDDLLSSFLSEVAAKKPAEEEKEREKPAKEEEKEEPPADDILADFFSEVSNAKAVKKPVVLEPSEEAKEDGAGAEEEKAVTEKYLKQDLGDGRAQCERLLARHHEWRNLNPYYVLQLDIDATIEDIKFRYKKLSLKVHPDRMRDIPDARVAFEYVKEAYLKLMDDDQRKTIVMHVENVTTDVKRERKRLLGKGIAESDLPSYEEERGKALMKHFADLEQMKRLSDKNRRAYNAREKMQEEEEEKKMQKFNEFDKEWSEENRREKRVGNWRDFQGDPVGAKRSKVANFKEEVRQETKHGVVKLEEWKKSWK